MPDVNGANALQTLVEQAKNTALQISKATELAGAKELIARLNAAKDIPLVPTEHALKNDGNCEKKEVQLRILKDYFVAAPAYHAVVRDIMTNINAQKAAADEAIRMLEDKISRIGEGSRAIAA